MCVQRTSPVAPGAFGRLSPPKLKYETLHVSEAFIKFYNVKPPCTNVKPPY